MIHYTLNVLRALIGPLFGILIAEYYLVKRQRIVVDELVRGRLQPQSHRGAGHRSGAVDPQHDGFGA